MQREIKFRAWDNDNKHFMSLSFNNLTKLYEKIGSIEDYFGKSYFTELDEFTGNPLLMQFTGLKDKNGKDVYEGDIFIYTNSDIKNKIIFHNGSFGYMNTIGWFVGLQEINTDYVEVIGNIYENPELLNK